jgi:hypothetical protein
MPEERRLMIAIGKGHGLLYLDASIGQDVAQLGSSLAEHLPDKEPTMALSWLPAAAEQRQPMLACPAQQAVDGVLECRLSGHISVQGMACGVVVLISLGSSTELEAQEDIPDASLIHRLLQVLAIEVWCDA